MTTNATAFDDISDPGAYKDWQLDFTNELEAGETVSLGTVVFTIVTTGLGFKIDGSGDTNPPSLDVGTSKMITFWTSVDVSNRSEPEFEGEGIWVIGTVAFTSTPQGRVYERSFKINFKQR